MLRLEETDDKFPPVFLHGGDARRASLRNPPYFHVRKINKDEE
jgi:hypothetical protein